jgi:NAD(P)-dependent dehydrogenase (short-subunit alcohol dehydrogenase family)
VYSVVYFQGGAMSSLQCLITGGNAGIGRAAALQLARQGAGVCIACRNRERGAEAVDALRRESGNNAVSLVVMDLASTQSILAGCDAYRTSHNRLDVLIHNAADFDISRKAPLYSPEGVETVWATNHVGPVLLTQQLGPELSRSAQGRVITVSSQGLLLHPFLKVDLDNPEFRQRRFSVSKAYYQSKLAQVMYTYWLAGRLRDTRITVNCVRVSNVKIDIQRYPNLSTLAKRMYALKSRFSISPAAMAEVYVWLALAPELADVTGGYFDEKSRQVRSGRYSAAPENIQHVMALTEKYVPGVREKPV